MIKTEKGSGELSRRDFIKTSLGGLSAASVLGITSQKAFANDINTNIKKTSLLRKQLNGKEILVMPGAYDALTAKLIEITGFKTFCHTGYGTSASLLAKPDVGLVSFGEMVDRVKTIADASSLPLLADGDTGYGNAVSVFRTVQEYIKAGAAGMFIEDQIWPKKCGHMAGKEIIDITEMVGKVKAAMDAKNEVDPDFVMGARTDAIYVEGIDKAVDRAKAYRDVGADFIFLDAYENKKQIERAVVEIKAPLLLNIIEGGKTPPITVKEAEDMGFKIILFPLAPLYAASKAIYDVLKILKDTGSSHNYSDKIIDFSEFVSLMGLPEIIEMEKKYIPEDILLKKYKK